MKFDNNNISGLNTDFDETMKSIAKMHAEMLSSVSLQANIQNSFAHIFEPLKSYQEELLGSLSVSFMDGIAKSLGVIPQQLSASLCNSFDTNSLAEQILESFRKSICDTKWFSDDFHRLLHDFSAGINISEKQVYVSQESLNIFSDTIEFPVCTENQSESTAGDTTSFSFWDFFSAILIPLLLALIAMAHTQYLHNLDALESQKESMNEKVYQEQHLQIENAQIEQEQAITVLLEQIVEILNTPEETPPPSCECNCSHLASQTNSVSLGSDTAISEQIDNQSVIPETD